MTMTNHLARRVSIHSHLRKVKKRWLLIVAFSTCAFAQSVSVCQNSATSCPATFTGSGLDDATAGGSYVGVASNHQYVATICTAATPDTVEFSRDGGTATACTAITGAAQRLSYSAGTVTAASWATGRATYTVAGHGLSTGSLVTITGTSASGYNVANAQVLVISSSQFSVAIAINPGTWTSGGTVVGNDGVTITWLATTGHTASSSWSVLGLANGTLNASSFVQYGLGSVITRNAQSKLRDFMPTPQDFSVSAGSGCAGCNDTAALQSCFNNFLRSCYMPKGTYPIDPDVVTLTGTGWQQILGENSGLFSTATGVHIVARSAGTNLIRVFNKIGLEMDGIYLDGNQMVLYPLRIEDQSSDLKTKNIVVASAADGGCNTYIAPASGFNTQIDYIEFEHTNFAGDVNGTAMSNVCNLMIKNNQTLRFTLYNPSFQSGSVIPGAISENVHIEGAFVTMYAPTFTNNAIAAATIDVNLVSGSLAITDGRSETNVNGVASISIGSNASFYKLTNWTHASLNTNTSLIVGAGFPFMGVGSGTVSGGQLNDVNNTSTTVPLLLDNVTISAGSSILGPYLTSAYQSHGTFTPVLKFGGGGAGIVGTFTGDYTKVGNDVTARIVVVLTNKGTATGDVTIEGLPFAASVAINARFDGAIGFNLNVTGLDAPSWDLNMGDSFLSLYNLTATGSTPMNDTNFSNTTTMLMTVHYFI